MHFRRAGQNDDTMTNLGEAEAARPTNSFELDVDSLGNNIFGAKQTHFSPEKIAEFQVNILNRLLNDFVISMSI